MATYRIAARAEWFYIAQIEADTLESARQQFVEKVRAHDIEPLSGPGVTFVKSNVTEPNDPR